VRLTSDKRQKNQLVLAFQEESRSEAPRASGEGTESLAAKRRSENPAIGERLMEEVCEQENCKQALARVKGNMQVLQDRWDRTFSQHSYGFRPGRSAHQAVEQAQPYVAEGYRFVVDLDLEKFFDGVNHDQLMAKIAERVSDK
jgi:hypothetical protein